MEYKTIANIGKPISRLVLGTMIISDQEPERSFKLLDDAFALGCTTLDTAHVYGGGHSERGIGAWMQARGNREQVVVISKGCHHKRRPQTRYALRHRRRLARLAGAVADGLHRCLHAAPRRSQPTRRPYRGGAE